MNYNILRDRPNLINVEIRNRKVIQMAIMVPNIMYRDESVAVVESAQRGNSFLPATFAN